MGELALALERFNRKERNLLVRAALGHSPTTPLQLSDKFRKDVERAINDVEKAIKIEIRPDAWWATDYHFSWLAGAFALYLQGESALKKWYKNPETCRRKVVEGNQEDIDLVIATGCDLILIEAKAYGWFSNAQMKSKVERLKLLHTFYTDRMPSEDRSVRFHLVLLSPREPRQLTTEWPEWACPGGKPAYIELPLSIADVLHVTRCDDAGISSNAGSHWRLVKGG